MPGGWWEQREQKFIRPPYLVHLSRQFLRAGQIWSSWAAPATSSTSQGPSPARIPVTHLCEARCQSAIPLPTVERAQALGVLLQISLPRDKAPGKVV